jgi:carboxyl-terminal processing protease
MFRKGVGKLDKRVLKIVGIALLIGIVVAGSSLGYIIGYTRGQNSERSQWRSGDWGKLDEALFAIEQYYLRETDRDKILEGALYGLVGGLDDPYSEYLSVEDLENMQIQLGNDYQGIGVEVTMENNRVTVVMPFAGSPAQEAGLLPGDQVIEVNGVNIEGLALTEAVQGIRGKAGTEVTLGIIREGLPSIFQVTVMRATIERSSVETEMLSDGIGYLVLTQFADSSGTEFAQGLRDLKKQGMKGLVLDLRDNPGGYLDVAAEIGRQIVPKGLIVYTEDREGKRTSEYSSTLRDRGFPMVVLVNENSASASEIIAGALQDNNIPVVGATSYGKGTVQSSYELGDGSYVKLTTNKFFTPRGKEIQGNGVTPDYSVAMDMVNRMPSLYYLGTQELGSEALHIYQLQAMMAAMGYLETEASGIYDEATAEAVAAFQKANNLSPSGKLDRETTDVFNQRWEKHTRDSDSQLSKALGVLNQLIKGN